MAKLLPVAGYGSGAPVASEGGCCAGRGDADGWGSDDHMINDEPAGGYRTVSQGLTALY